MSLEPRRGCQASFWFNTCCVSLCHCFFFSFQSVCVDLSPCALCGILPVLRLILVVLISLYLSHNHFASLHQLLSCLFEGHLID